MTKDRFVEIAAEYGCEEKKAGMLWDAINPLAQVQYTDHQVRARFELASVMQGIDPTSEKRCTHPGKCNPEVLDELRKAVTEMLPGLNMEDLGRPLRNESELEEFCVSHNISPVQLAVAQMLATIGAALAMGPNEFISLVKITQEWGFANIDTEKLVGETLH